MFRYKENLLASTSLYFLRNFAFHWFNDALTFDVFIIYGNGLGNDEWAAFTEHKGTMPIANCDLFNVLGASGGPNNCEKTNSTPVRLTRSVF